MNEPDESIPDTILFRDGATGTDYKMVGLPGSDIPYAAIIDTGESREVHPYAALELDTSYKQGRFVLRLYERIKGQVVDHKKAVVTSTGVITGIAVAITVIKRRHK